MADTNPVKNLINTNPKLEIWWDSSPLIFEEWIETSGAKHQDLGLYQVQKAGSGNTYFGDDSLLRGATTNQPLTWQVIEKNPSLWREWLQAQLEADPDLSAKEAMWRLFIEVATRGANMLATIFETSGYRQGQICCQVDPRDMTDLDAMLIQARRIHAARPNLMVKMPGTKEGIEGVRILTAEGIPTNVTLGFTVPQLVAVGEAAQAGLAKAQKQGVDLAYWRSCAVMMLGRYEEAPPMQAQAREGGIQLTEADLRWAGIAIFRKAHRLFQERHYPSQLMAASMRPGPTIDGQTHVWHLEKLAGADAVLTVFPNIFEMFIPAYTELPLEAQIDEPVPDHVMDRLLRIPYFAEAYDENGLAPEDFVFHAALQATAASFSDAMEKVETFAANTLSRERN
jgi:transaldolase